MKVGREFVFSEDLASKRVLIYGSGHTSYKMYKQIEENCDIVIAGVSDPYIDNIRLIFDCPCYYLFQINRVEYDWVIIAECKKGAVLTRLNELENEGVGLDKVIVPDVLFIDGEEVYSVVDSPSIFVDSLIKCNRSCYGDHEKSYELSFWARWYYSVLSDKKPVVESMKIIVQDGGVVNDRIMAGLFLAENNCLDPADARYFIEAIRSLPNEQFERMVYLIRGVSLVGYSSNHSYYKGMGKDIQRLWEKSLECCELEDAQVGGMCAGRNSVVIVASQLKEVHDSSSMMIRLFSNTLAAASYRVKILVVTDEGPYDFGCFEQGNFTRWEHVIWSVEENRNRLNDDVMIEYIHHKSFLELIKKTIKSVREFNPSLVIDATDELLPVSKILIKDYPVLQMTFRGCPSAMWYTKTTMPEMEFNLEIGDKRIIMPRTPLFVEPKSIMSRKEKLGVSDTSFVVVTAGNRIGQEISDELFERMNVFLTNHNDAVWVLIGDVERTKNRFGLRDGKVVYNKYEKDLPAFFRLCDVFLNPIRNGGGFSIACSLGNGVPVLCSNESGTGGLSWADPSKIVSGGEEELIQQLEALYNDRSLLDRWKDDAIRWFERINQKREWEKALIGIVDILQNESERDSESVG